MLIDFKHSFIYSTTRSRTEYLIGTQKVLPTSIYIKQFLHFLP